MDLALDLPVGPGRRVALEIALRDAIRTGRLQAGAHLPSSRSFAADLGVARGTVTAAYEQLVAEGWLVTHPGAQTAVAEGYAPEKGVGRPADDADRPRHDFSIHLPDLEAFPYRAWTAAMRHALNERPDGEMWHRDLQGNAELRARLLEHLARTRGVVGRPDDVIVTTGFTQAVSMVATVLRHNRVRTVAVEDPSHPLHREILAGAGLEVIAVPVDEDGLRTDLVPPTVGAVFVTPGHHFPTGAALSAQRRKALVSLVTDHDIVVFEDDYVGEFHYGRNPPTALQALVPDHACYAGSVSKMLTPGLRLGWLVAPRALLSDLVIAKHHADNGTSALDQLAIREILASGALLRHVRRQRLRYRDRRDRLVAVLKKRLPNLRVHPLDAGLYLLVELPQGCSETEIITEAARAQIRIVAISDSWINQPAPGLLAIGYTATPAHRFRGAVDNLVDFLVELFDDPPR